LRAREHDNQQVPQKSLFPGVFDVSGVEEIGHGRHRCSEIAEPNETFAHRLEDGGTDDAILAE
jgi:hypothetical protein